ncbi:RNA polymerase sigma-70 factor (ECF subfamily) [Paenibacillus endophyticus]|uniref:RNA polymerase sigma-70 factor (ECF subfamily) n=1 Tax=Paenibacillus endophyticus TaxID=1294268 RepID=A0A7W5CDE2_9BACL|nr:sigma-70 family RNA polymerase sigma factor [Paenibacillus endophyticus]MBB3155641.1 RNA polymerase sigma-70 factor (ECF subfamily) [Paenibacillus endophyticus]
MFHASRFLYALNWITLDYKKLQGILHDCRLTIWSLQGGSVLEEEKWIKDVLSGTHESYTYLVKEYQSKVYHVCLKITREEESAKELAHVSLTKAFYALSSYREDAAFGTWLYRIAVRTCLDWRKANQREWRHREAAADPASNQATVETPEKLLLDKEMKSELMQLVKELKEPYKSVVYLYFFRGLSYREIAEQTGAAEKTIESQLYRAKQILRKNKERFR